MKALITIVIGGILNMCSIGKSLSIIWHVIMACEWMCLKRMHMSSVSNSLSHASQPQRPRRVIALGPRNHW